MCGRFVSFNSWAHLRQTLTLLSPAELPPNYNVAPTQQVLVARGKSNPKDISLIGPDADKCVKYQADGLPQG